MNDTSVTSRQASPEQAAASEPGLRPRVDVFEDTHGITLYADLPGVSSERLAVHVDKETLVIEGTADVAMPEGMQALHAELQSREYRSAFALSAELDADAIRAELRDGVLQLRIPKRAELRPRRIEVNVA